MAIAFQTESHATTVSTTTVVTKPTGTADGDLLIVTLGTRTDTVSGVPSGWTLIDSVDTNPTSNILMYTYWKIAASEGASWEWTWSGSNNSKLWSCLRFDGADSTTPINSHGMSAVFDDATPSFSNGSTPSVANCMMVISLYTRDTSAGATSAYAIATDDPTWTERSEAFNSIHSMATATGPRTATSTTGNTSVTLDGATPDSICSLIAIAPLTVSGPTNLKSFNTNVKANIKSYNTNVIANVKSVNTNI